MIERKKNAHPSAALEQAMETGAASRRATTSISKFITSTPPRQAVHIADFLSCGPENGVTLRHLEKLTDLPGREVRRKIERERRAGVVILSDNRNGYFLASDPAEVQRFARSMRHRAREIIRTVRAIERGAGLD